MLKHIALTTLAVAATFGVVSGVTALLTPAVAQVNITFGSPPPPVRYEVVPAPRAGYIWAPGHWQLVNDQHAWVPGQWQQARAGYRYVPDSWERQTVSGRDQWRYQPSRWDKDGDGIPNKYDTRDNRKDDRTYNATNPWGDRDHDGVPNVLDNQNNNRR